MRMPNEKVYSMNDLRAIMRQGNKALQGFYTDKLEHLVGIEMYPHESGILVEGKEGRQWVYFVQIQPDRYDWSFWKIERKIRNFLGDEK